MVRFAWLQQRIVAPYACYHSRRALQLCYNYAVTPLDVLSGGRAYLGIGAAWNEKESRGLGVAFPTLKTRFEMLEEALQITQQMWRDDSAPIVSTHFQLANPLNRPQPLSAPHPPIMIGGGGEQKTLKLVAQYADACNLFGQIGGGEIRRKLDVLRGHCETVGRDYETIERTAISSVTLAPDAMSANDVIAHCRELVSAGIQHVIFSFPNNETLAPLETIGREVIPAVADL